MVLIPQSLLPPYKLLILKLKPQSHNPKPPSHIVYFHSSPQKGFCLRQIRPASGNYRILQPTSRKLHPPLSGDDGYFLDLHNFP